MATAKSEIFKVANPAGWTYTFDRTDSVGADSTVDAVGNVASATAAIDAIKPLIGGLPGILSKITVIINTFE